MDLLLSKGIVDSHSLHKVSYSFSKVMPSERIFITTGVIVINNTKSTIQLVGHTPIVVFLDTCAQPMILRVQFTNKMGMLNSNLRKFMWQICIINGSVKEVLGESLNFIVLNFNENTHKEFCLQVRCLVTNATNYNVLIG